MCVCVCVCVVANGITTEVQYTEHTTITTMLPLLTTTTTIIIIIIVAEKSSSSSNCNKGTLAHCLPYGGRRTERTSRNPRKKDKLV